MRSARALYRVSVAVAAVAIAVLALTAAVTLRAVALDGRTAGAFVSSCQRFFLPNPSASAVAVLVLGSFSLAVFILGSWSLARQLLTTRRFLRGLHWADELGIGGIGVRLLEDASPQAFCAGYLRPRVYVSTAALERLDDAELAAVIAHERHHQARRDPLRILIVQVLADALFFVPILRGLRRRYAAFAEIAADEAAVQTAGGAGALASALLAFGQTGSAAVVVGIAPQRVDSLFGETPRWELPVSLVVGGLVTLLGLGAFAVATAAATSPGSLSGAALAMQACMTAMTAAAIILGAWLLLLCTRRLRARGLAR